MVKGTRINHAKWQELHGYGQCNSEPRVLSTLSINRNNKLKATRWLGWISKHAIILYTALCELSVELSKQKFPIVRAIGGKEKSEKIDMAEGKAHGNWKDIRWQCVHGSRDTSEVDVSKYEIDTINMWTICARIDMTLRWESIVGTFWRATEAIKLFGHLRSRYRLIRIEKNRYKFGKYM